MTISLEDPTPKRCPSRFLTPAAKASQLDGIREFYQYETDNVISLLFVLQRSSSGHTAVAGRPNISTFPIKGISVEITDPHHPDPASGPTTTLNLKDDELRTAIQYGATNGVPALIKLLEGFQEIIHKRPKGNWNVTMGSGCQDLIYKALSSTVQPGDPVICEAPLYAGVLPGLQHLQAVCVEVEVDEHGLSAKRLGDVLANWPEGQKRPRVLYTNPIGGNPSGTTAVRERKLEILKLCVQYDILIIEDDPYYFLSPDLVPSYFELETEVIPQGGQVMRFDSFSKVLAGGFRLGFVTAPPELLYPIEVFTAATNLHAAAVSQMIIYKILTHWGVEGFLANARNVALFYAGRKGWFEEIAHRHLDGLARWTSPMAGLFLWVDCSESGVKDTSSFMYQYGIPHGIVACPGASFYPSKLLSPHIRVSFSELSPDKAEQGFKRLAEALRHCKADQTNA